MKRLGTLLVAAVFAVACGSSSKNNGNGNGGSGNSGNGGSGNSGNGGSSASGGSGNSGNGGSSASGGSGNSGNGGSGNSGNGGSGNSGNGGSGNSGNGGSGNSGNGGSGNSGNGGSGNSANGGSGGSGGAVATPQCTKASDCTLHSDCCNCLALAPGEKAPACNKTCVIDTCTSLGIKQANVGCTAGACNAGIDCDPSTVTCLTAKPTCPKGEIPSVKGKCWGPCVMSTECSEVPDCNACDGTTSACVVNEANTNTTHCVQVPPACGSNYSCACMANALCLGQYDVCVYNGGFEVDCVCSSC